MIISASRRTDIPAYYSKWFINRIKKGFLYVRNPMNAHQVSRIQLSPDVVDCIVFWTKNPIPMIPLLDQLKDYNYYFQFTLTGYGKDIETSLPDKQKMLIPAFQELSEKIGKERVIWRYDPIVFNPKYNPEYHIRAYTKIAESLRGYTEKNVISFVDFYQKIKKNMDNIQSEEKSEQWLLSFSKQLHDIAEANGMSVGTCAEKIDLSSVGIQHNSCIDKNIIEKITGCKINVKKDSSQRTECQCVASIEVGTYNSCANGCKYCYANFSPETVKNNMKKYDPDSPLLCDTLKPDDKITDRPMKSLLERQITFLT